MPEITASAVKALRDRTGLPMMECKQALVETNGDFEAAIEWLRKAGRKTMEKRADRQTAAGRIAVFTDSNSSRGAMIELFCESAPVANNEQFIALAQLLAQRLAEGPGEATSEELLGQPVPGEPGITLRERYEEVNIRIREAFRIGRMVRLEGVASGYVHHDGTVGVLLQATGGPLVLAKDICMHIAAMQPTVVSREDLDQATIDKEREILLAQAQSEGKSGPVLEKIIQGRLQTLFAERCLLEQPFVKSTTGKETVRKVAEAAGMKIQGFVRWTLGKE